jgi:3'(2'), 5'-bisphosphate nucleotidase
VDLTHELETAKTIARMAAGICQSIQAELVNPAAKSGNEPVTIADYASQAVIGHALAENYPDDAVLSEERSEEFMLLLSDKQRSWVQRFVTDALGGYVFEEQVCAWLDFGKAAQAERTWIIDPIDGTKGFIGLRHYCVALGLLIGGEPVLGVLASPGFYSDADETHEDLGVLTYGLLGSGAWMEPLAGGPSHPIEVSEISDPRRAIMLASYEATHTDRAFLGRVAEALGRGPDASTRLLDSQDKHAMIASGGGDVYLRVPPRPDYSERVWDQAAGYAIVKAAGGQISDLSGRPLDWSTGRTLDHNRGVLITNGHLHDALLEAIHKAGG